MSVLYLPHFYPSFSPTSSTQPLSHTHSLLKFMTSSLCTWIQGPPCRLDNILGGSPLKKTWFSLSLQSPTACRSSSGDAPCERSPGWHVHWYGLVRVLLLGVQGCSLHVLTRETTSQQSSWSSGSYNLSISSLAMLVMLPESQGLLNDTYLRITTTTFQQTMPIVQECQNSMLLHFSE